MFPRNRPVYGFICAIIAQCQSFAKCKIELLYSNRDNISMYSVPRPSILRDIRGVAQTVNKVHIRRRRAEDGYAFERVDVAAAVNIAVLDRKAPPVSRRLCNTDDVQIVHARRIGDEVDRMPELCLGCPL